MWIELSKLVLCFYFCSTVATAYQSQLDYIRRNERYPSRYVMSGSSYNYKVSKSRYPNLEKVKNRIENMNNDAESWGTKTLLPKIRHKGWTRFRPTTTTTTTTTTENGLFETYGDLEGDGDFDDYDNLEDEDGDLDYDDDDTEDPFFDTIGDIQAEEPTERPTVAPKPVSSFTEYKWRNFGSPSDVAQSRRNHLNPSTDTEYGGSKFKAVIEHNQRVTQQARCGSPSPKVISVQKEYPDPTKTYTPHCTVLHRCGEDTGCCKYDNICQYKNRVLVQLYFYSQTLGSTATKVEKLSFYNHTECECRERSNETSAEQKEDNSTALSFKSSDRFSSSSDTLQCKCPKHFKISPIDQYNACHCDCEEENADCVQLKMGNEHFSMTDRICILNNDCTIPACEYGTYSRKEGKCPNIKQKMMDYKGIKVNY